MIKIDFSSIFRISKEGIYYADGFFSFENLIADENGWYGEERYENGEFLISFYSVKAQIVFSISRFGVGEDAVKKARAKSGSCLIFLREAGIKVKEY